MTLPSIGDVVDDKFRIERKLGEGGTSTIFEVRHVITEKRFALKWLSPELAQNELAVQLFIHEAKICGRFEHPNVVQIYDICRNHGSLYLLMEFLEGESLEMRLHRVGRFLPQAACDVLLPCMDALSAAHRVGIIHSDFKPSNVFMCGAEGRHEEVPKVLDFGIAQLNNDEFDPYPFTETALTVSGTPLYMAPEQMRGLPSDARLDVYSVGVVLYELVAGDPPFESDNLADLVRRIVKTHATPLDQRVEVDPAFAEIVARAMARDLADRYATMADFAHALRPWGTQRLSPSVPPPQPVKARRDTPSSPPRSPWSTTITTMSAVSPRVRSEAVAAAAAVAAAVKAEAEAEAMRAAAPAHEAVGGAVAVVEDAAGGSEGVASGQIVDGTQPSGEPLSADAGSARGDTPNASARGERVRDLDAAAQRVLEHTRGVVSDRARESAISSGLKLAEAIPAASSAANVESEPSEIATASQVEDQSLADAVDPEDMELMPPQEFPVGAADHEDLRAMRPEESWPFAADAQPEAMTARAHESGQFSAAGDERFEAEPAAVRGRESRQFSDSASHRKGVRRVRPHEVGQRWEEDAPRDATAVRAHESGQFSAAHGQREAESAAVRAYESQQSFSRAAEHESSGSGEPYESGQFSAAAAHREARARAHESGQFSAARRDVATPSVRFDSKAPRKRPAPRAKPLAAVANSSAVGSAVGAPQPSAAMDRPSTAPPVRMPPAKVATASSDLGVSRESFGDVTPWTVVDAPAGVSRMRGKRSIGVLAVVGGALIVTWYTLAREPQIMPSTANGAAGRTAAPAPDTTAARDVPRPYDVSPVPAVPPAEAAQVNTTPNAEPVVAVEPARDEDDTLTDAQRARLARRAERKLAAAKRRAVAKENKEAAVASRRASDVVDIGSRGARSESRSGLTLTAANASREHGEPREPRSSSTPSAANASRERGEPRPSSPPPVVSASRERSEAHDTHPGFALPSATVSRKDF